MSRNTYVLRCVLCLQSFVGSEPRDLARQYGAHVCDPHDRWSLEAFRAAARWLEQLRNQHKGEHQW